MALHKSMNPYFCRVCKNNNPKYNIDFRCEKCLNKLWVKRKKTREKYYDFE